MIASENSYNTAELISL